MELVYRTIDGEIFETEEEALKYEAQIKDCVKMWDKRGTATEDTSQSFAVILNGENAAKIFKTMCQLAGDDTAEGIEEGDEGIYFWNDWERKYQWLDCDSCFALLSALQYAQANCPEQIEPIF